MTKRHMNTDIGATHSVLSKDGTKIGYLSRGGGPSVLVLPGVLSMAADYAAFARALAEHFTVHTIERRLASRDRRVLARWPQLRGTGGPGSCSQQHSLH
jgi:hypothetical protein